MVQWFLFFLAIGGIVRVARTRGATPWVWGLLAASSFILLSLAGGVLRQAADELPPSGARAALLAVVVIAPWIPVALVALYVRFVVGRGSDGPYGRWTCPGCRSINESYALKCESCGVRFQHPTAT